MVSGLVTKMRRGTEQDRKMLTELPREKLLDLLFLHIRNLWRVDGLYFVGIEERYGTEIANEMDRNCLKVMGKIEARELRKLLEYRRDDMTSFMQLLRNTSWSLDQQCKEIQESQTNGVFRVTECATQKARIGKGLGVFPCKQGRFGYLKSFAAELNPNIEVTCNVCPPDPHREGLWCEWEFMLRTRT